MAGTDRRSSGAFDRRASLRLSFQEPDAEDYALAAMGISDGFRPADVGAGNDHDRISSSDNDTRTPPPRPSSTTKPKAVDSFALRHDGAMGAGLQRDLTGASNANPVLARLSTVSTEMAYVRPESPYQGHSGPSHPYQMYPQESRLARTESMATTTTVQVPERPYNGLGGPTHPYGMYPQNTVPEGETANESIPAAAVPVGFTGLSNTYQRRLGPEGEEIADIIGPDGHTEQLPPYTQYPDEAFARKARPNVPLPVAGAGGIGLATRNPEFSSQEDLNSPSRRSTQSVLSESSHHPVNIAALGESEKPQLKKWQQIAKRKVCHIVPVWAIVLIAIIFILFAIILAAVLTMLKPRHSPLRHHYPSPTGDAQSIVTYTSMTTTFDATPIHTPPPGLPALPTGTFALPIPSPYAIQSGCIQNTDDAGAWSCSVPMTSYTITLTEIPGASSEVDNNEINLGLGNSSFSGYYAYGTQPPVLNSAQVLNLVIDSQEPTRGPAWFFELPYNKVVILPENQFVTTSSKRDTAHSPGEFMRKQVAQPGDKPWFCYWNGTLLEGFIYTNLTNSYGQQQASSMTSSTSATSIVPATSTYGSSVPTSNVQSSSSSYSGASQQPNFLPNFPKVVKIEERRIPRGPQSISPYCVQHIIDQNGIADVYLNSTGQSTTLYLNETDPSVVSQIAGRRFVYGTEERSDIIVRQNAQSCGCVWLVA